MIRAARTTAAIKTERSQPSTQQVSGRRLHSGAVCGFTLTDATMLDSLLLALGAGLAVALELLEAAAIVLAVELSRRWSDALIGAAAAVMVCATVAIVAGPLRLERLPKAALELAIGVLLLYFGLEWLRKGTLRLAGRRAHSSALREHLETREQIEALPQHGAGRSVGRPSRSRRGALAPGRSNGRSDRPAQS
jgi:hypothetical protein